MTADRDILVARLRSGGCVFAEEEAELLAGAAETPAELEAMVARRLAGEPLEQVVGWAEFCGLRIGVEPGVFVPRRRTELLAEEGVSMLRADGAGKEVRAVDLCCGSGAIGLALLASHPDLELIAVDVDPAAVACATRNLAGTRGRALAGDLFEPLPAGLRGKIDLLMVNAPYVPSDEMPLLPREARLHEPRRALDGGGDGLEVIRRVAQEASAWLAPEGHFLVETSEESADEVIAMMAAAALEARVVRSEERDATVVVARRA